MFRFLLLLHLFVFVASRSRFAFDDQIFRELLENELNDANLNPGFNLEAFRDGQLQLHNYYRSLHGAPLMSRDEELTNRAQEYAETLAERNGDLEHCELPACDRNGAGENLAYAGGSTEAEINATKAWYDEIWDYNFCYDALDSNETRPGHNGKQVGHFTQVVWEGSTKLGIGYARNANKTKVYIVGRYISHGNVLGYYSNNVKVPEYILDTFQNNCNGTKGGLTDWMGPGTCSRSCGGGIQFLTKTCTNPKPSLDGADCVGETKQLVRQWCNIHHCPGNENHRDSQCTARGFTRGKHYEFGGSEQCKLYCFKPNIESTVYPAGDVDDGTHCNSGSGACLNGECTEMPTYDPGTPPPTTTTTEPETTTTQTPPTPSAPETTTQPKMTTTEPETTTTQPLPTPPAPESTIQPATTTTEPETTTTQPPPTPSAPESTIQPATTTTEPETTTTQLPPTPSAPETTTQPATTTTEPETTTTQPSPTPSAPETTTQPATTTTEPETTTTQPSPTPSTPETTIQPETTTTEPETTTTQPPPTPPETTTAEPETTTTEAITTTTPQPETTTSTTPETTPTTSPRRRFGRFAARIRPGWARRFLVVASGKYRITLIKGWRLRFGFLTRLRTASGARLRWRRQCRLKRRICRFQGIVPVDYQLEVFAYVPRCRRGRRTRYCYRPRVVRLFYRYEF